MDENEIYQEMPDTFTPAFDVLLSKFGPYAALVYGKIWRYQQMPDQACWASQSRIARELGIDRKTVNRYIKKLIKAEYIKDLGKVAGGPKMYITTDFLEVEASWGEIRDNKSGFRKIVKRRVSQYQYENALSESDYDRE